MELTVPTIHQCILLIQHSKQNTLGCSQHSGLPRLPEDELRNALAPQTKEGAIDDEVELVCPT